MSHRELSFYHLGKNCLIVARHKLNTWVELVFHVSADKFHFYLFIFCALVLSSIANGTSFGICVCVCLTENGTYEKVWFYVCWIDITLMKYISKMCFDWNVFDTLLVFFSFPKIFHRKREPNPFKNNRLLHAEILSNSFDIVNLHTMNCTMLLLCFGEAQAGGRTWGWFHIRLKISLTENLMRHKNQIYCIIRLMTCFHSLDWAFNCSLCVSFGAGRERVSIFRQYFHKAHTMTSTHTNQSIGVEKRFFFQLIFRFSYLILATVLSHCHFIVVERKWAPIK